MLVLSTDNLTRGQEKKNDACPGGLQVSDVSFEVSPGTTYHRNDARWARLSGTTTPQALRLNGRYSTRQLLKKLGVIPFRTAVPFWGQIT